MYRIREAAPGIFMVTRFWGPVRSGSSVNTFVLTGKNGLVFDPGYGSWRHPHPLVRALGDIQAGQPPGTEPVRRAMASHSHWDHFSGLHALQAQLDFQILATRKQAGLITSKKALRQAFRTGPEIRRGGWRRIREMVLTEAFMALARVCPVRGGVTEIPETAFMRIGDRNWQVLPAPGHCDDDIVLYCQKEGILLGGDLVLRTINTWLGPPRSDLKTYVQSLEMLAALPGLRLILPAHGSPVPDPVSRIGAIVSRRQQKAGKLCRLLAASGTGGMTADQILAVISPGGGRIQKYLSKGMLEATLDYLVKENLAAVLPDGNGLRYKAI